MRKKPYPLLFALTALSACVTVPNTTVCTVAGTMSAGAICAETLTDHKTEMDLDTWIEFLEPQLERSDPSDPAKVLPARAGALCQSAEDWNKQKTALEQACRMLGKRCSRELIAVIKKMAR